MPSFSDSIFLFVLALLLFGPKQLPKMARELGKWVGEFRRASNEFKMQMEDELRASEQEDRRKQVDAMEAAAPVAPALPVTTSTEAETDAAHASLVAAVEQSEPMPAHVEPAFGFEGEAATHGAPPVPEATTAPLPIATSGELKIMPPATGLPMARRGAVNDLAGEIPVADETMKTQVPFGDDTTKSLKQEQAVTHGS